MKQGDFRRWGAFVLLSLALVFADARGLLEFPKSALLTGLVPAQRAAFSIKSGLDDAVSLGRFWRSGEARIKNLEQRNLEQVGEVVKLEKLMRENEELRKQLGVSALSQRRQLPAEVLGLSRQMIIGVGKKDGAGVGQSVVYLDNLIGRIIKSSPRVSYVELPTDSDAKIPVKVGKDGIVRGIAIGQYNSAIVLDQVAQNEVINEGDLVVSSGEEEAFVSDLILGRVGRVLSGKTDILKRAEIDPLVEYGRLKTVFVLID